MALPTVAINKTKIKFRFAEPYTSEASNFQAGINDVGVYRGGTVIVYGSAPSTSVAIATDGTATVAVHRNDDGYGTVVNETSQVVLDLTSAITWPVVSGGLQLYIYLEVSYAADAETTGLWGMAELADLPDGAVRIAMLDLPAGATEILSSYIRTDGYTYRHKTLGRRGILVPRVSSIGTGSGRSRFKIVGRVSCLGTSPADTNDNRAVMLLNNLYPSYPLTDGTSADNLVYAGAWYAAVSGGTALTLSDMDEDGCYTDPYVQFAGVSTFDASLKVAYYSYVSLDDIVTTEDYHGFVFPHANRIKGSLITGTSDTVAAGYLPAQLLSLLNKTSEKIDTINPNASSTTWALLWRSNDISSDSLVDGDTLSIYYRNTGVLLCKGGYISGTNFIVNSLIADPSTLLYCHSIYNDRISFRSIYRAGPATIALEDSDDWAYYSFENQTSKTVYNVHNTENYDEYKSIVMNGIPDVGTNAKYIQIFNLAESELRIYFASSSDYAGLLICSGCYWSDGDNLWKRITTASRNASQFYIGRDGIRILNKDKDDADFATGWEDLEADWTHVWEFGDSTYPYLTTRGESIETSIVPFQVSLNSGHVMAMATHTYNGPTLISAMNFRTYRSHVISAGDFTYSKLGSGATLTSLTASDIGYWGAKISGNINIVSFMTTILVVSIDSASAVTVSGIGHTWIPGQIFAIKGTTSTGVYVLTDWSEGASNTTLTIDTGGDAALIDHGGTMALYTVIPADENEIIEAFYEVQLF